MNKKLVITLLILAIIGFLDATFLTVEHYIGGPIPCAITHGCDTVTNSVYASVAGIPDALLGALYYLTLVILLIIYLDTTQLGLLRIACRLCWIGLLVSLVLIFLQLFVIKALCFYCLISATDSTLLFILSQIVLRNTKPLPSAA